MAWRVLFSRSGSLEESRLASQRRRAAAGLPSIRARPNMARRAAAVCIGAPRRGKQLVAEFVLEEPEDEETEIIEDAEGAAPAADTSGGSSYGSGSWQGTSWNSGGGWRSVWSPQRGESWSWNSETRSSERQTQLLPEILLDVVLGWLLLMKSGLDAGEWSSILAMTRNKLSFETIETALRQVWQEEDVRARSVAWTRHAGKLG